MKEGRKVPRRGFTAKREVLPDPIYNDVIVTKLINNIMLENKQQGAYRITLVKISINSVAQTEC